MIYMYQLNKVSANRFHMTSVSDRLGSIGIPVDPEKGKRDRCFYRSRCTFYNRAAR